MRWATAALKSLFRCFSHKCSNHRFWPKRHRALMSLTLQMDDTEMSEELRCTVTFTICPCVSGHLGLSGIWTCHWCHNVLQDLTVSNVTFKRRVPQHNFQNFVQSHLYRFGANYQPVCAHLCFKQQIQYVSIDLHQGGYALIFVCWFIVLFVCLFLKTPKTDLHQI